MENKRVSRGRPPVFQDPRRFNLTMPGEQFESLGVIARMRNTDRAHLVREAVEVFIVDFFSRRRLENHPEMVTKTPKPENVA